MPTTSVHRILDAALNRAGEGLRVAEDYTRFVLDDPFLTQQLKSLRHDLTTAATAIAAEDRHAARDTSHDVGTSITTLAEQDRPDAAAVCAASLKRAEQALRSLEEYGKLAEPDFAKSAESLRYRLYTLEKAIDVNRISRQRLEGVRLCVLVDGRESASAFETFVDRLVGAGPVMIQLRDKKLNDRELLQRAWQLRRITRGTSALAIINDRVDIAAAVQADGVHLGQEDLPVKEARAVVGTQMLIGVSTHNIDQARAAVLAGANFLGAGPTFPSQTKQFDQFAGLEYLGELVAEVRLPTFAIGGITAERLPDVLAAGIRRIAVGATVTAADEPVSAAQRLLSMLHSCGEW